MNKINYVIGDATYPIGEGIKIICHVANDKLKWGAGFVLAISKRWKAPEAAYRSLKPKDLLLGKIQLVQVEPQVYVANMVAQHDVRPMYDKTTGKYIPPIRYAAVRAALTKVNNIAYHMGATLHMPRIGCGLAGGVWEEIEKIITEVTSVDVYVYDLPADNK
jgi:O-acetyl-ADP-ribose deacetylase (regulator of RNase III)